MLGWLSDATPAILGRTPIRLAQSATDKWDALRQSGEAAGRASARSTPPYADAILERERPISTYMGEGVAIPHGTDEARRTVRRTALAVPAVPGRRRLGRRDRVALHRRSRPAATSTSASCPRWPQILLDAGQAAALRAATDPEDVLALLSAAGRTRSTHEGRPVLCTRRRADRGRAGAAPGPGEVKIRVRNCSTCGTDVKIYRHGHHHIDPPRVMGHEIAGEVVEIGADGRPDGPVGDRVQVIAAIPAESAPTAGAAG